MRKLFGAGSVVGAAALAMVGVTPWSASAAEDVSFAGKRIELIVPFSPGGGSDVYARALQPYLEKYLPGNPTIIVRNIPGGGSIPGANQFQARAKPDGTNAIVVSATTVANFVFQKDKARYKMNSWEPVLLSPQGAVVYASPSLGLSGPKDIPKLKGKDLVFGGDGPTSGELRIITTFELLGLEPKFVWGLRRGPTRLAFERGEFNINYDSAPGFIGNAMQLVKAGKAVPLYALGVLNEQGEVVRDPNFKDLPSFPEAYEIMHGKKPSGPGYDAWKALLQMGVMANKALLLPDDTPQPVLDAWRNAVRKVLEDPEFEKKAAQVVEGYPQFVGESAKPIMKEATDVSPEAWDWIKGYLKNTHNTVIK